MKKERTANALFMALWILADTGLVVFGTIHFLHLEGVVKKVFWVLMAFCLFLSLCIMVLDPSGSVMKGTHLKNSNPKLYAIYRMSFRVIIVLIVLSALLQIAITWD